MTHPLKNQVFTSAHADAGTFEGLCLRPFSEYRDLVISGATQGRYAAHVIRAVPGMESPSAWQSHDLDFQMVFVTQDRDVSEYEGEGQHILYARSCVSQTSEIKHRGEVRHLGVMELIEILSPVEFDTRDESAP